MTEWSGLYSNLCTTVPLNQHQTNIAATGEASLQGGTTREQRYFCQLTTQIFLSANELITLSLRQSNLVNCLLNDNRHYP